MVLVSSAWGGNGHPSGNRSNICTYIYIYTYFALKLDETWILQHVYNFNSLLRHPYINQLTKGIHRWKIINLYPHHPHQSRRSICIFGLLTKFPDQGSLWKEKIELMDPIKTYPYHSFDCRSRKPFGFGEILSLHIYI